MRSKLNFWMMNISLRQNTASTYCKNEYINDNLIDNYARILNKILNFTDRDKLDG